MLTSWPHCTGRCDLERSAAPRGFSGFLDERGCGRVGHYIARAVHNPGRWGSGGGLAERLLRDQLLGRLPSKRPQQTLNAERSVAEIDLPEFLADVRRRFDNAKLARVGTLPCGDRLHVVASDAACLGAFYLGGLGPHRGRGLILGQLGQYELIKPSSTKLDAVVAMLSLTGMNSMSPLSSGP